MEVNVAVKDLEALIATKKLPEGRTHISPSYLKRTYNEYMGLPPITGSMGAFDFGEELHRLILEPDSPQTIKLSAAQKEQAWGMESTFSDNYMGFLEGADVEVTVTDGRFGGRLDILHDDYIADLKTTSAVTEKAFVKSLITYDNFIQALFYCILTGRKKFYFLGLCKKKTERFFLIDCDDYPEEIARAEDKLKYFLRILNNTL